MNKLRVGVLMGGKSIEKEVSFNSGRTVCDHLDTARYDIVPLFQRSNGQLYILPWRFLHRGKISDFEHRLDTEAQLIQWDDLKQLVDFIYIATHGRFAEDGTLQGLLEVLQIPYLGSKLFSSAVGMDKIMQKEILKSHGIATAKGVTITPYQLEESRTNNEALLNVLNKAGISLPYVVKPYKEGSSLGISVIRSAQDLIPALVKAATIHNSRYQTVLIEEYLKGLEFSCIVITDYKTGKPIALPPTEIVPETGSDFFDYEQKYMPGRATKFTPARCSSTLLQQIQETCIQVMHVLEMENLARIDGFVTQNGTIVITDPNTLSGMAPSSFLFRQAAEYNMSHTTLINHLIETELHHYNLLNALIKEEQKRTMSSEKKIRVAVLLGGRSHEKEISLESGRNIFYKLSPHKYEAKPLFVDNNLELYEINQQLLVRNSTKEITLGLTPEMKVKWSDLPQIADFVFIGLHGGEGENGCIQGTLEMLAIPYNGSSVLTSALCMDKFKTTSYLKSQGFEVPKGRLVTQAEWQSHKETLIKELEVLASYPFIVKPHDDGCSVLVAKARTQEQLMQAIDAIFADGKTHALVEECITGMELTVGVIGNYKAQALPPSRAVVASDILSIEEKFLPGAGENQTPAPLPVATLEFVKRTMEKAYESLNCKGYVRIDCFYQSAEVSPTGKERVVFIEVNTLPGLTPATCIFHQAAEIGIKPMDFIDLIIKLGLEEHTQPKLVSQVTSQIPAS